MFNCHQGIYYSYILFCRHVGADFNGRFLDGYRCVKKTNIIAKSSKLNSRLFVWSFGIPTLGKNDIINEVHIFLMEMPPRLHN